MSITPDLHEMVQQLTAGHQHREPYTYQGANANWDTAHQSTVPALLLQLVGATPAGGLEQMGRTPGSRPAARIEALDTIMLIDDEAGEWLDRLGERIPADRIDPRTQRTIRGTGTVTAVRKLWSLHRQVDHCGAAKGSKATGAWCCPRHQIEHDVRSWWHQARIITGWDTAAYRPHNTCPICEQRDSLRIRLDGALCVECRTVWDQGNLGLLAEHIRAENGDDTAA